MTDPQERSLRDPRFADGSIELFAGLSMLGIGLCWLSDQPVFGAVLPALSIPIWRSFHERHIAPRLGSADLGSPDVPGMRRGLVLLCGLGVAVLVAGLMAYRGLVARDAAAARDLVAGMPATLLGVAALSAGLGFRSAQLALYAVPCVLAGAMVVALDLHPGHGLFASGIAPALVGAVRLARFLRSHP
ncbi:MAG: hypothetical protein O2865_08760, partial [Planctomycetota bacterium]|nr:hypothetical protein [Planctomycetota bacterium]MDA1220657.1 hypothetical protein [Planctomycetota bacterium]